MVNIDDDIYYSIENSAARIKNLYGINDFYNFIKKPDNTPSTHRHFQVFFYPEFNNYKDIINDNGKREPNEIRTNIKSLFDIGILEKITLSIQNVDLPQYLQLMGNPLTVNTVLGAYSTASENQYFDAAKTLTFTLIDQMKPLFEKFFTKWIFLAGITETDGPSYKYGYPFPKMNIAIKYYRQDQISENNENLKPNFIYYFRGVYPTSYQPCKIAHAVDIDDEIKRKVVFNFNTCWVLPNAAFARRYKLEYLFNTQNQLSEMYKTQQELTDLKAAQIDANKKLEESIKRQKQKQKQKEEELLKKMAELKNSKDSLTEELTQNKSKQSNLQKEKQETLQKIDKSTEAILAKSKQSYIATLEEKKKNVPAKIDKEMKIEQEFKKYGIKLQDTKGVPQMRDSTRPFGKAFPQKNTDKKIDVKELQKSLQEYKQAEAQLSAADKFNPNAIERQTRINRQTKKLDKEIAEEQDNLKRLTAIISRDHAIATKEFEQKSKELTEKQKVIIEKISQNDKSIVDLTKQIKDNEEKSKTAISSKIRDTNKQIEELNKKLDAARKKKDEMASSFKFDE